MIRINGTELAHLELFLWLCGRESELRACGVYDLAGRWRPKEQITSLATIGFLLGQMLRFTILDALVEGRHIALDVRLLLEPWLGVRVAEICRVIREGRFGVFIVNDGAGLGHVLSSVRLLLEVILLVNIFNDSFVLALYILDFFLEVFELEMKSFDLLVAADIPCLSDGLRDC